jgi:hypothetical protein
MAEMLKRGISAVVFLTLAATQAEAKHLRPTHCATSKEVTAIAATSIQQELMVAALTCNQIANFNAFQTSFSDELRASDHALMKMFTRLYGGRGTAEYHGFKTRLANDSEIRSIHANSDFCTAAASVFAAALTPAKPSLHDVVAGVQVVDPSPVDSCELAVVVNHKSDATTQAATAGKPGVVTPSAAAAPTTTAATTPAVTTPPAVAQAGLAAAAMAPTAPAAQPNSTVGSAATAPTQTASAATPAAQPADQPKKKKSGWFSSMFN